MFFMKSFRYGQVGYFRLRNDGLLITKMSQNDKTIKLK